MQILVIARTSTDATRISDAWTAAGLPADALVVNDGNPGLPGMDGLCVLYTAAHTVDYAERYADERTAGLRAALADAEARIAELEAKTAQ